MNHFLAWSRHLWLWLVPFLFCAVNILALAVYQTGFAGKVDRLQEDRQRAEQNRDSLRAEYAQRDAFLQRAKQRRAYIVGPLDEAAGQDPAPDKPLYAKFSTASERFSVVVREVKRLARQAGLDPRSFGYPEKELAFGLVQRDVSFSVDATYDQLRTLINLLELSDHFLMLDNVGLGRSTDDERNPRLSVHLSVATVFVAEGEKAGGSS